MSAPILRSACFRQSGMLMFARAMSALDVVPTAVCPRPFSVGASRPRARAPSHGPVRGLSSSPPSLPPRVVCGSSKRGLHSDQMRTCAAAPAAAMEVAPSETTPAPEASLTLDDLPTSSESPGLLAVRHSAAHVMAMAVQRVHKGARCTIGPWIDRGFYYDFDMPQPITEKDLPKIQKEMKRLIKRNLAIRREEVPAEVARRRIESIGEPYKLEILDSILKNTPDAPITIYHIGEEGEKDHWWDLCAGPHVASTGAINAEAIELESVAGAYWRGDEQAAQLQRIYGTAWESRQQLDAYKHLKAEATRRDHRRLGAELDLFSIQDSVGGGLVLWHPNGAMVRHQLETFWKDMHLAAGYKLLYTPHIAKGELWQTSGHLDFYRDSMYGQVKVEDESYQLKPMNCPCHVAIFKARQTSYRDLPLRWAELGTVYRYERSGTMHGLFRVRGFTQDDAHIFCLPDQIAGEIRGVLDLVQSVFTAFGFDRYEVNLSTRPAESVGSDADWAQAEAALVSALEDKGWPFSVDEGGGAFYGPKIDIKIQDAIGRRWQCSTVQLDFNLPERFGLAYTTAGNEKERPIMIHRALLGSLERFMGILIEHHAGAFPLWLAPEQVRLLPTSDAVRPYMEEVASAMRAHNIRVEVAGGMSMGKLVRNAEKAKVPVMCVVGPAEAEAGTLSVRTYRDGPVGALTWQEVLGRVSAAVASRSEQF
ncbi:TST2 [Auxenochlorella protothecoides x Auxenochlorella symbiontica]